MSASGKARASTGQYAFGLTRFDSSKESRKYANTPRDESIGVDVMGARTYVPELGVFSSVDPLAVNAPEKQAFRGFSRSHTYAYAANNPVVYVDPTGNSPAVAANPGTAVVGGVWTLIQHCHQSCRPRSHSLCGVQGRPAAPRNRTSLESTV